MIINKQLWVITWVSGGVRLYHTDINGYATDDILYASFYLTKEQAELQVAPGHDIVALRLISYEALEAVCFD